MIPRQLRHSTGLFRKAQINACIFTLRHLSLLRLQEIVEELDQPDLSEEEKQLLNDEIVTLTKRLTPTRTPLTQLVLARK